MIPPCSLILCPGVCPSHFPTPVVSPPLVTTRSLISVNLLILCYIH